MLLGHLERLGNHEIHTAAVEAARMVEDDGVNYTNDYSGASGWHLDPLPYAIGTGEWARLERALTQRLDVFNAILDDAYTTRSLIRTGVLPAQALLGHPGFLRQAAVVRVPGPHQLLLAACDVGRDADGRWRALADRVQAPNGPGFAMENRRIVSRVLPGVYRGFDLRRLSDFFETLRVTLQSVAAKGVESPRVVLLSPGALSGTAFDQAHLATILGFPLATAEDLQVHSGRLWLRTVDRQEPVDVVFTRVDAAWCDPLDLRPDSTLGVPGLLDVARRGNVTIVNPLGAAVLDNPALYPYFDAACRAMLGEDLLLRPVDTWWLAEPSGLSHARAHAESLILRHTSNPLRVYHGDSLARGERESLIAEIASAPQHWVAQEVLPLSTTPSLRDSSAAVTQPAAETTSAIDTVPTSLVLRTFACAGEEGYEFMAGGLARVAPSALDLQTSRHQHTLSKDVWVIADAAATRQTGRETLTAARLGTSLPLSPRVAEGLYWFGRYVERAEFLVRLQREHQDRRNEFEQQQGDATARESHAIGRAAQSVLPALERTALAGSGATARAGSGATDQSGALASGLMEWMVDEKQPGSLAQTFISLTQTARSVRDQMSPSTWSILSRLSRSLRVLRLHQDDAIAAPQLQNFMESTLAMQGVMNESMVRDDGWNLMDAGRRIERASAMTVLLHNALGTSTPGQADALLAESSLVIGESIITYRRRYASTPRASQVLELLARDERNPRSIQFQLDTLHRLQDQFTLRIRSRRLEEALQDLSETVSKLDVWQACITDSGGVRRGLHATTAALHGGLGELASAIELTFFPQAIPQRPL
ncbi:circularly permuted type 2 ATP-grasp protein [Micrococcales bacterium 31B]|nr:circularly permuted type 2 ATP-grasp protein [Micrococcales bacterium 31B]